MIRSFLTISGIFSRPPTMGTFPMYLPCLLLSSSMMQQTRLCSCGVTEISRRSIRPASPAPMSMTRSPSSCLA